MRLVITSQRHGDAMALIRDVAAIGVKLQSSQPAELAIGNTVRKVLHIIREEKAREEAEREDELLRQQSGTQGATGQTPTAQQAISERPASGLSLAIGVRRSDSDASMSTIREESVRDKSCYDGMCNCFRNVFMRMHCWICSYERVGRGRETSIVNGTKLCSVSHDFPCLFFLPRTRGLRLRHAPRPRPAASYRNGRANTT